MKSVVTSFLAVLLATPAVALDVGDAVDPQVLAKLNVDPAKVTVIDFFAEWCESCRKELPLISGVHAKADGQKVAFLGVDTSDDAKLGAAFQEEMRAKGGLSFTTLVDPEQQLVSVFAPKGYPALYILQGGKIVKTHLGAVPNVDELLAADFSELLGEDAKTASTQSGSSQGGAL
jgi:cytochrome c biogenesis protein CcmG, thiol:disulfide interchange protein DsbE